VKASILSGVVWGVLLACPWTLAAQGAAVSGGIGLPIYLPDLTPYETSFEPPLLLGLQGTGRGTQALTLDRSTRPSFWGAIEWFPAPHAGLVVRGSFLRTPFEGTNTPYQVTLDYLARQPPDSVERQYHYERTTPWPDTTGHLDTWSFDLQASVAGGSTSGVRVHADGGLSLISLSGSFGPVGFTTFQLGGHAVLFPNEYELVLAPARTWSAAAVISGGISLPLGSQAGIDISGRAVLPRTISADVNVLSVRNDTAIGELSIENAQRALAPVPLEVKLGTFQLLVGIRVGL
jgi:hypothetical protein